MPYHLPGRRKRAYEEVSRGSCRARGVFAARAAYAQCYGGAHSGDQSGSFLAKGFASTYAKRRLRWARAERSGGLDVGRGGTPNCDEGLPQNGAASGGGWARRPQLPSPGIRSTNATRCSRITGWCRAASGCRCSRGARRRSTLRGAHRMSRAGVVGTTIRPLTRTGAIVRLTARQSSCPWELRRPTS